MSACCQPNDRHQSSASRLHMCTLLVGAARRSPSLLLPLNSHNLYCFSLTQEHTHTQPRKKTQLCHETSLVIRMTTLSLLVPHGSTFSLTQSSKYIYTRFSIHATKALTRPTNPRSDHFLIPLHDPLDSDTNNPATD
jgi:hypothetical protein